MNPERSFFNKAKSAIVGATMTLSLLSPEQAKAEGFEKKSTHTEIVNLLTKKARETGDKGKKETYVVSFERDNAPMQSRIAGSNLDKVVSAKEINNLVAEVSKDAGVKITTEDFIYLYHTHPLGILLDHFSEVVPGIKNLPLNSILTGPSEEDCFQDNEDHFRRVLGPKKINVVVDPGGVWVCSMPFDNLNPDAEQDDFVALRLKFLKEYNLEMNADTKKAILDKYISDTYKLTNIKMIVLSSQATTEEIKRATEEVLK